MHMPTGAGKTRTTMNLISEHLRQCEEGAVLWLASTKELCEQATLEFEQAWSYLGNRELPILTFWGGKQIELNKIYDGLVVATPQTLYNKKQKYGLDFISEISNRLTLIVFDEAHQAIARTYRDITEQLAFNNNRNSETKIIGLTATPGKTFAGTQSDIDLVNFFRNHKVTLQVDQEGFSNPVRYLINKGYIAEAKFELLVPNSITSNNNYNDEIFNYDIEDNEPIRIDRIEYLLLVYQAIDKLIQYGHRRILIFAASVELSNDIAALLRTLNISADSIHSGTPSEIRAMCIERYRSKTNSIRILVNFGILTTGFDAPQTSAAVIARPTKSLVLYSQMIGRAIRGEKAG
ncbi:MAG: restriction endonuclease [Cyanobacteria bacterium SW_9_44_58]|nr:MAG: restriction endonuclease [Cyanobacteria bacterium SW_9_44_58]